MSLVTVAIALGLLAIIYGFVTSRQVLGADAGSARMQEIAGAIQEMPNAFVLAGAHGVQRTVVLNLRNGVGW